MRNIKLTLEYDGTGYFGFQKQKGKRTIHAELERAMRCVFHQNLKIASASGRTDAGVHAKGHVVNFKVNSEIPIQNVHRALNRYLPENIAVLQTEDASLEFHARFQAKRKKYEYLVWNSRTRSPLKRSLSYFFPFQVQLSQIKRATVLLRGRKNFNAFCSGPARQHSVRTLYRASVHKEGHLIRFIFEGDGFLQHMVRNMVGALLMVGRGKISVANFHQIIQKKNRQHMGPTAPAVGLTLLKVKY